MLSEPYTDSDTDTDSLPDLVEQMPDVAENYEGEDTERLFIGSVRLHTNAILLELGLRPSIDIETIKEGIWRYLYLTEHRYIYGCAAKTDIERAFARQRIGATTAVVRSNIENNYGRMPLGNRANWQRLITIHIAHKDSWRYIQLMERYLKMLLARVFSSVIRDHGPNDTGIIQPTTIGDVYGIYIMYI